MSLTHILILIFWESCERIYDKHSVLLRSFRSSIMSVRAQIYAQKIRQVGPILLRCIGFIDVTKIQICRPGGHQSIQQSIYSGQKHSYCLLFCTVTTADDLIFFLRRSHWGTPTRFISVKVHWAWRRTKWQLFNWWRSVLRVRRFCIFASYPPMVNCWLPTSICNTIYEGFQYV